MAFHPVLESARFIRTMQLFDHRMYSFEKFPWEVKQIIDVTSLAESGLFYTKLLDKCMCSFCLCVIEGFCLGDTADDRHLKENPDCPFLKKHVKNKFSHEVNKCPIKLDVRYEILDTKVDCKQYGEELRSRFSSTVTTIAKSPLHHTAQRKIHRLGTLCGHW